MLLSKETTVKLDNKASNIVGHMCYAAYKLWNVCNYERMHYRELGLERYPDWFYQKSEHRNDLWYKNLPAQTAQEVCKQLDESWKSFYELRRTKGTENPHPPHFKKDGIAINYIQKGIVHEKGSKKVRLSLSKQLKGYMGSEYGIHEEYLYLENEFFQDMDLIKRIRIYPPEKNGMSRMIVVYEIPDPEMLQENGHCLSIDLGLHNLMTCYDNAGRSFILGRKYLETTHRYDKEIARVQSQWGKMQAQKGIRHPRMSKHVGKLYQKKRNSVKDYLHKVTAYVTGYCVENEIHTAVIGDIKGIRKNKRLGSVTNQKLHGLPYGRIYKMLEYKLKKKGIRLLRQKESYSSQCSPESEDVSKKSAEKRNRRYRGLYVEKTGKIYNADVVGAYNILRKNNAVSGRKIDMPISGLNGTKIVKVAV